MVVEIGRSAVCLAVRVPDVQCYRRCQLEWSWSRLWESQKLDWQFPPRMRFRRMLSSSLSSHWRNKDLLGHSWDRFSVSIDVIDRSRQGVHRSILFYGFHLSALAVGLAVDLDPPSKHQQQLARRIETHENSIPQIFCTSTYSGYRTSPPMLHHGDKICQEHRRSNAIVALE